MGRVSAKELVDLGLIEVRLQPIVSVTTGSVVAAEALARFPAHPGTPVDAVFSIAHASGWGAELEAACLRRALARATTCPAATSLTVNVSPDALRHPEVRDALRGDLDGIVVEITEKSATDSAGLVATMNDIRRRGGRIAIDDASTGYAGPAAAEHLAPRLRQARPGPGHRRPRQRRAGRGHRGARQPVAADRRPHPRRGCRDRSTTSPCWPNSTSITPRVGRSADRAASLPAELPEIEAACRRARRNLMDVSAGFYDDLRGTAAITAALAGSTEPADVRAALAAASAELGVDVVGLSTLTSTGSLREVTAAGADVDPHEYQVADYPATQAALRAGRWSRPTSTIRTPTRPSARCSLAMALPACSHAGDRPRRAARHPRVQQLHLPPLDPPRLRPRPQPWPTTWPERCADCSLSQTARRSAG